MHNVTDRQTDRQRTVSCQQLIILRAVKRHRMVLTTEAFGNGVFIGLTPA